MFSINSSLIPLQFFIVLSFLLPIAFCHNWLGGLGRANLASTHYPHPIKIDPNPHMQIGLNQTFTVDWSAGHGNTATLFNTEQFSYFFVLHFDDRGNLPLTPVELYAILENYLAAVPKSGNLSHPSWHRNHLLPAVKSSNGLNNHWFSFFSDTVGQYFKGNAPTGSGDPQLVPRPASLMSTCKTAAISSFSCDPSEPPSQWFYKDSWLNWDLRAEYYNPTYPWIESVHRFQISVTETVYSNSYQTASFRIPARKGPGNYMLMWAWQGYFDVIDINVQVQPTANPYGPPSDVPPSGSSAATHQFVRVDHCEFSTIFETNTPCRIVDRNTMNISQCLADCLADPYCEQVQVMRVGNPPRTISALSGIPTTLWDRTQNNVNEVTGSCGAYTQRDRLQMGCQQMNPKCDISSAVAGDYVCFGSQFFFNPNLEATDGWTVVPETEDPTFYNTCYFKRPVKNFLPHPPYPQPTSSWIVGDFCLDCSYWRKVEGNLSLSEAPNWEGKILFNQEGECRPCTSN
jgi:hypothetical protein